MSVEGLWRTAGFGRAELEGRVLWRGVRRGCPADSLEGTDFGEGCCSAAVSHCRQGAAHQMRVTCFGALSTCWSACHGRCILSGAHAWQRIAARRNQAPRHLLYNSLSTQWSAVCSMMLSRANTAHSFSKKSCFQAEVVHDRVGRCQGSVDDHMSACIAKL